MGAGEPSFLRPLIFAITEALRKPQKAVLCWRGGWGEPGVCALFCGCSEEAGAVQMKRVQKAEAVLCPWKGITGCPIPVAL